MQKLAAAPLFVAVLALAGCGSSTSSSSSASASASASEASASQAGAPAPAATAVTGTVKLQNPAATLAPQATLELSLVDVTQQPGVTINKQHFDPPTFPQAFHIPFSESAINPNDLYVVQATMQDNGRTYTTKLQQPVLTRGQPAHVDITLAPEPTKAEALLEDFNQTKRQTGGMAVKTGTSSKIGESQSWQVFSNQAGVQFIIMQVNDTKQGFTKTEYAYHNSLPWVMVQTHMPKPGAPATKTVNLGWGNDGVVVLNQSISGGKTTTVSDAETKTLHKQAEDVFNRFTKHH